MWKRNQAAVLLDDEGLSQCNSSNSAFASCKALASNPFGDPVGLWSSIGTALTLCMALSFLLWFPHSSLPKRNRTQGNYLYRLIDKAVTLPLYEELKMPVHQAILSLLAREQIEYRSLHHAPTFTSEESARVRGEDIRVGGKAIVMKVGEEFRLFVLSAALKVDATALKQHFGVKKIRFATPEELLTITGLVPGSIPPFGQPILPFELFVDPSILDNTKIAFNAGSLTESIIMTVEDYLRAAQPAVFPFAVRDT